MRTASGAATLSQGALWSPRIRDDCKRFAGKIRDHVFDGVVIFAATGFNALFCPLAPFVDILDLNQGTAASRRARVAFAPITTKVSTRDHYTNQCPAKADRHRLRPVGRGGGSAQTGRGVLSARRSMSSARVAPVLSAPTSPMRLERQSVINGCGAWPARLMSSISSHGFGAQSTRYSPVLPIWFVIAEAQCAGRDCSITVAKPSYMTPIICRSALRQVAMVIRGVGYGFLSAVYPSRLRPGLRCR